MSVFWTDDLPAHTLAPGIRVRIMHGDAVTLMRASLAAGAVLPPHRHPHEQVSTVLSGAVRFTVGGQEHALSAGATVFIPGNVEHSAIADVEAEVIDVFTPVREDYRAFDAAR
jgi:quercetin dioxygenase-like cupin family protein